MPPGEWHPMANTHDTDNYQHANATFRSNGKIIRNSEETMDLKSLRHFVGSSIDKETEIDNESLDEELQFEETHGSQLSQRANNDESLT